MHDGMIFWAKMSNLQNQKAFLKSGKLQQIVLLSFILFNKLS